MADDWYRRKTWTPKDREEFFAKLQRSRGAFNKAQYARIQAYELVTTRTPEAYPAALELLDMILAEWPAGAELAAVHHQRAGCFLALGDVPRAVDAYQQVFQAQRACSGHLTGAPLDFGWLAVTVPLPELYDEALAVLDEFPYGAFPVSRYRASAIHALIFDDRGKPEKARNCARIALEEAAARHSGFRNHATLGLVETPDERVHTRLQALAK